MADLSVLFLSTPSARRATSNSAHVGHFGQISIHALREEGDVCAVADLQGFVISIHALREEGDHITRLAETFEEISIHALREEGDSKNRDKISIFKQIIQHSARI